MDPAKKEELDEEIMALESIFPDEFTILETEPFHKFEVFVQGQAELEDEDDNVNCVLQFEHCPDYPDTTGPVFSIPRHTNLSTDQLEEIRYMVNAIVTDNLGTLMVYTIISAVQDKMHDFAEAVVQRALEDELTIEREREEEEKKKFIGVPVTIETFMVWKTKFDSEMATERRNVKEADTTATKKKTGKEMFLENRDLDASDLAFLTESLEEDGAVGGEVEVDESLFEELNDLDLTNDIQFSDDENEER